MYSGQIYNNIAQGPNRAGGVIVRGGTFNMRGGVIRDNQGTGGGGVRLGSNSAAGSATFNMQNATTKAIHSNHSTTSGGGIHIVSVNTNPNATNLNMQAGIINIENNTAALSGGGIHLSTGTVSMTVGTIRNNRNTAPGSSNPIPQGGGVSMDGENAIFRMTGGTIGGDDPGCPSDCDVCVPGDCDPGEGNRAVSGGGVWVGGSARFYMVDINVATPGTGRIVGNTATGTGTTQGGGGVFVTDATSRFNLHSGTIEANRAHHGGGVMVANGTFNMHGGYILNHRFRLPSPSTAEILEGGGVHVAGSNSNFRMHGGTIGHTNPASGNMAITGGGVFVGGGARFFMQDFVPSGGGATIPGTGLIEGNNSTGTNYEQGGGGVFVTGNNSTFEMDAGTIRNNTAQFGGGGVGVMGHGYTGTTFTMTGGIIGDNDDDNNRAQGNTAQRGGGVWILAASFTMEEGDDDRTGRIVGNHAIDMVGGLPSSTRGGGGVFLGNAGTSFTMRAGEIHNNFSTGGGAGVNVSWHTALTMHNGEITNNHSTVYGGGVFGNHSTTVTIHNGIIRGNQASAGGGIRANAVVNMHGGRIYRNTAVGSGGGVHILTNTGIFTMTGGIIGGQFGCPPSCDDCLPGYCTPNDGNVAVSGGGVQVGSGVAAAYGATFIMSNHIPTGGGAEIPGTGQIVGNIATGTGAAQGGGGVMIAGEDSRFDLRVGTVETNRAHRGGGFMTVSEGTFNMYGGTIRYHTYANLAEGPITAGGGVFVGSGTSFNLRDSTAKTITRNQAANGGGVYVTATGEMRTATGSSGVNITYNNATYMGGGIFTENFEYAPTLSRIPANGFIGSAMAYGNLTLNNYVFFNNNTARHWEFSPTNAIAVLPNFGSVSNGGLHPLNNYDINYIFSFQLPLTGGIGTSTYILTGGVILAAAALAVTVLVMKKRMIVKPVTTSNRYRRSL